MPWFNDLAVFTYRSRNYEMPSTLFVLSCPGHRHLRHKNLTTDIKITQSLDVTLGSAKANGREPISCLGWVFSFKKGYFVICAIEQHLQAHHSLKLKTQLRVRPVVLSLSMVTHKQTAGSPHPFQASKAVSDIYSKTLYHITKWH